jgi:translation initiation factor 1
VPDDRKPFHNPFAVLRPSGATVPDTPIVPADPTPAAASAVTPGTSTGRPVARAVVRIERSGRGGKEVTVVEHLNLPVAELEQWLKALKSGLGCGGAVESDAIVLQGDQRKRLPPLLTARGVKKITVATR